MPVIEKRYAEALAGVCESNGSFDATIENFNEFMSLLADSEDLKMLLFSSNIHNSVKKETLQKIFTEELDSRIKNLIFILLDKGRIRELTNIYKEFIKISNMRKDVLHIKIMSSTSLTTEQIDKIKEIYKAQYNKKSVDAELVIDKKLLGGLKVQIGDKVVDFTVKSRMDDLARLTGAKITH